MWTILTSLTGLGTIFQSITQAITSVENKKTDADIQALHDRRAVLVAEAGNRLSSILNASAAFLGALGPLLYINKIFIWDKVIGSFVHHPWRTDALDPNLWIIVTAVFGYFFLTTKVSLK